ncbi:MAG: fused MFS/spermidine synthase [Isosphaeraceae bacterium]
MAWLFGSAMFLAALLLFSVQPMVAKMVLPILGGTPGVWNTCMVFYQAALLAGYAYAHWGSRLRFAAQWAIHAALLLLAILFLPIVIPAGARPPAWDGIAPALWLVRLLVATAGVPLVIVASTAPLLQRWFSRSGHRDAGDPYFLYAASNAGSLCGLLAYPFLIEPTLSLGRQGRLWSLGFVSFAALVAASGLLVIRQARPAGDAAAPDSEDAGGAGASWRSVAWWMGLAFIPSSWMLAVTTYVTTDLAAIPLIWTIPLGLYLLTYILAFSRGAEAWRVPITGAFFVLVVPLALVLSAGFVQLFWVPLHLLVFFLGALLCHGRLAAERPPVRQLTAYYLALAAGGVLGGIFNALVAPVVFDRLAEYPLALVLACLAAPAIAPPRDPGDARERLLDLALPAILLGLMAMLVARPRAAINTAPGMLAIAAAAGVAIHSWVRGLRRPLRFALTTAAVLIAGGVAPSPGGSLIYRERDFFGVLRVLRHPTKNAHRFFHGSTLHGQQSMDPEGRREPSTYFARSGPIGDLFRALEARPLVDAEAGVAIVGLGAGTLACYAQPGQAWSFYEIDPAVVRIAEDPGLFTYLADARAVGVGVEVVLGDARLRLQDAQEPRFRFIVLDAFSSDAVPVHLLTREAIRLYRSRLAPGGLLAFNLSNRYLDLDPVIGRQAEDAGLLCRVRYDFEVTDAEREAGKQPSIWAVLAATEEDLGAVGRDPRWVAPRERRRARVWTDDDSDLASHLILRRR